MKNLYKLEVDDCATLSMKSELVQSQDIGELWHRQMGHLHHGALKIMQHISTGLPKGNLSKLTHAKVVPWECTQSLPFMIETIEQRLS